MKITFTPPKLPLNNICYNLEKKGYPMIEEYIGLISLLLGIFLLYKLNPINVDPFLRKKADRVLNHNAECTKNWNSEGRVYCTGLALITLKNGKKKFIKQSKLCDTGILH